MHWHEQSEERHSIKAVMLITAGVFYSLSLLFFRGTLQFIIYLLVYLLSGWSVLKEAVENIRNGNWFDENFLMSLASIGAFCIGEYPEAVAVMLLYEIGERLQDKAVDSSRKSIRSLLAVRPDRATLISGVTVPAKEVDIGDIIIIRPGDRVPLDGVILDGTAMVDTSALTGEAMPRRWSEGDTALSGCIVQDGVLKVQVTKNFGQSSVSRILELVEDAQENKAKPEQFITRFAKIYTPVVCGIAVLLAILPPMIGLGTWTSYIHKALSFLVISCPCALVLSVPLTFFAGIGSASQHGILLKGGNYLELLAKVKIAVFDKTGTLTQGSFCVTDVIGGEKVLEIAAYCENQSTHPLAKAVLSYYKKPIEAGRISHIREIPGEGISAILDGVDVRVGKREFVAENPSEIEETAIYVSENGKYLGYIILKDTLKPDAEDTIKQLRKLGISQLIMLSGDRQKSVENIAKEIGLNQAFSELLPTDKVNRLKEIKRQGITIYTGDGINDAPVLASADIGIAMGGLGSDAAMEAADIVILSDEPSKIATAIEIARKTIKIAKENIIFSVFVKVATLTVTVLGNMALWMAVLADVGVCFLAVMNSLRALNSR